MVFKAHFCGLLAVGGYLLQLAVLWLARAIWNDIPYWRSLCVTPPLFSAREFNVLPTIAPQRFEKQIRSKIYLRYYLVGACVWGVEWSGVVLMALTN